MSDQLTVVCMLWSDPNVPGKDYTLGNEHVRVLKSMVARHLHLPHRFVCLSEEIKAGAKWPFGLSPGVEYAPLDHRTHRPQTRFAKLQLFRKDIGRLLGERILYLDLDAVIVDDITPLVDRTEDLVLWRNPRFDEGLTPSRYNTSMILLTAGVRPDLYDDFDEDAYAEFETLTPKGGTDQRWVSDRVSPRNPYWQGYDGVYGAGGLGPPPTTLPGNARIVFTPGNREPSQPHFQEKHPWAQEHYK